MGRPPKEHLPASLTSLLELIGHNLRQAREAQGLSQAELARQANLSTTTVNEIETRRVRDIRVSTLLALADTVKLPVVRLLAKSDIDLSSRDQARLLKASEDIVRVLRRTSKPD